MISSPFYSGKQTVLVGSAQQNTDNVYLNGTMLPSDIANIKFVSEFGIKLPLGMPLKLIKRISGTTYVVRRLEEAEKTQRPFAMGFHFTSMNQTDTLKSDAFPIGRRLHDYHVVLKSGSVAIAGDDIAFDSYDATTGMALYDKFTNPSTQYRLGTISDISNLTSLSGNDILQGADNIKIASISFSTI